MQFHRFRQLAVLAGALLLAGCVAEGGPDYRPPIRPWTVAAADVPDDLCSRLRHARFFAQDLRQFLSGKS
jgi:hypothetical protein